MSATVDSNAPVPPSTGRGRRGAPGTGQGAAPDDAAAAGTRRRTSAKAASEPRGKVRWYWRVLAWVAAVPLGFLVTAWPAYQFGWIKKDDVLNVFVGTGTGRYARLAVGTLIWALVTALLVQLFVEGGRAIARRRRARRDAAPPRAPKSPAPPSAPKTPAASARR